MLPISKKICLASFLLLWIVTCNTIRGHQLQTPQKEVASRDSIPKSILNSVYSLGDVVITAKEVNRGLIAPQVLSKEELKTMNSLSVADAIRFFSGIQLKDYGGIGGIGTLDIRNMGTNPMNVFYNGIQLKNSQRGQIDLGVFSLDNIDNVQLYNGQKSQIFQSAKEFGYSGSIYLTSRRPEFKEGDQANMKASLKAGSFGMFNPSVLFEYKISDDISASFSGEWTNANGRYKFNYRRKDQRGDIVFDTTAVRQNGDINSTRLEAGLYGIIDGGKWTIRAYNYNSEKGIPGAIVNNEFRPGERLFDRMSFIQATMDKRISEKFHSSLNMKYSNEYTPYTSYETYTDNKYYQKEFYFSSANLYSILENWDLSLSVDFQYNNLDATYNRVENEKTFPSPTRYSTWVSGATSFEWWKLKAQTSMLLNLANHKVKQNDTPRNKSVFTPSVIVVFKPFDKHELSLNAYLKQMFRMPTFNDLYYTDMGNPFLKPEHSTQYNVGIKYSKDPKFDFWKNFEIESNAYYHEIKDKIIAYPRGMKYIWEILNLGKVEVKGINVSMGNIFEVAPQMYVNLKARYTYEEAQDFSNRQDSYYGHQIPYIPLHSGSAMVALKYHGWSAFYSFIYTGERYNQQENFYFNYTQPFYTSDLALVKEIEMKNHRRLKLSAEINNLFSQDYDVILNYPMPKINYRFTISIEL